MIQAQGGGRGFHQRLPEGQQYTKMAGRLWETVSRQRWLSTFSGWYSQKEMKTGSHPQSDESRRKSRERERKTAKSHGVALGRADDYWNAVAMPRHIDSTM